MNSHEQESSTKTSSPSSLRTLVRSLLCLPILAICLVASSRAAPPPPENAVPEYVPAATPGMARIDDKAYVLLGAVWKAPIVPVCWELSTPKGPERAWVASAIEGSWNAAKSKLKFIGFGDCATNAVGVRIAVRDVDVNDGPHTLGLGSQLDRIPSGVVLNFTFKTWGTSCATDDQVRERCIRSIAVHEFGHVAGFSHEQNSPDTPGECARKKQGPDGDAMLTPWDLDSVMNYCNPVRYNSGVLSELDKKALHHPSAYGRTT